MTSIRQTPLTGFGFSMSKTASDGGIMTKMVMYGNGGFGGIGVQKNGTIRHDWARLGWIGKNSILCASY
jgi:hypothetical protein